MHDLLQQCFPQEHKRRVHKCRVIDQQLYPVLTQVKILLVYNCPCVSHSSWCQREGFWFFLKGQMTLNAEAGWRMRTSRKDWRRWALVMTDGRHVTDFRCKSSSTKQKNRSLQPVNVASEWTLKGNQTGCGATRAGLLFKRCRSIHATEGPPNLSRGPLRCSHKNISQLKQLFN